MGIKNLMSIIRENAPDAIVEGEIKNHFGRKVAIVRFPPRFPPPFPSPVSFLPPNISPSLTHLPPSTS